MIINFKGFENTGIGIDVNKYPRQILPNNKFYITPPYVHLSLTTTLNNNNSPDKKNFREILYKFPNSHQCDTINFHYDKYYSPSLKKYKKEFWLNDKPLILNDSNLKIFSQLSQLFKKISNTDFLPFDDYYIKSSECKSNFNYFCMSGKKDLLPQFHNPETVRKNAKYMSNEFIDIMLDYFSC